MAIKFLIFNGYEPRTNVVEIPYGNGKDIYITTFHQNVRYRHVQDCFPSKNIKIWQNTRDTALLRHILGHK